MWVANTAYQPKEAANVTGVSVVTASYVQVIASTAKGAAGIVVNNQSLAIIKLAIGAAASEVDIPFYVAPGSIGVFISRDIRKGSRISARAVDTNGVSGTVSINLVG